MHKRLTVHRIKSPGEIDPNGNIDVFKIKFGEVDFSYLYLLEDVYTLAWTGSLDFKYLDDTARFFLYKQIDDLKPTFLNFSYQKYVTQVSLIVADKLIKYSYEYSRQPDEYRQILVQPKRIAFARYDFRIGSSPLSFSFTAENPEATPSGDSEIAVSLPRSRPLTKRLLRWIVGHHRSHNRLNLAVDYHNMPPALTKVIETECGLEQTYF